MYSDKLLSYSGYNLRGTFFANHQISHLAVIFAIIKFANHCMYPSRFVWPEQHMGQPLIDTLIISASCNPVQCCNTCHGPVDSFTVKSLITG